MTAGPSLPARYTVPELIAHGGMGDVYRATDETLDRTVAIKLLAERYARQDEFHERFLREARLAASLSGEPSVVAIHDVGETEDGLPFIVMEYVPDGTVADHLRSGPLEQEHALRWLSQAAAGIDAAHRRGIIHRDVKPANLLIAADGTVRVSDFGIARAAGHDTLTAAGTVLGSSGYMAPEQARGQAITPATDRYALACVAFECLTGRRPFERENVTAEAAAHANEEPPSARELTPSLPRALDPIFARGLAKSPDDRFESCAELVSHLRRTLADDRPPAAAPVIPTPMATTVEAPRVVHHATRPRRGAVLLVAAALLAAGGGLAWALTSVGDDSDGSTVVLTETLQGETVERTVTESDTVEVTQTEQVTADETTTEETTTEETTTEETTAEAPPAGVSGVQLNDRGFALLQQGDVDGALPVLEQAVAALSGSATIAEAYASYNLATARFGVGRCDGVLDLLDRSQQVQGERKEIDRLRRQVERRCSAESDD
ncbi:MAG: protein kinase [Actinobacteria bacterium]|nr:protein kinase [Actinomycetota bacterium]